MKSGTGAASFVTLLLLQYKMIILIYKNSDMRVSKAFFKKPQAEDAYLHGQRPTGPTT
jgi:hypothetical protein